MLKFANIFLCNRDMIIFFLKKKQAQESKGCLSNYKSRKAGASRADLRLVRFAARLDEVLHLEEALRIYAEDHRVTAPTFPYSTSRRRATRSFQHCPHRGDVPSKLASFKWAGLQYIAED